MRGVKKEAEEGAGLAPLMLILGATIDFLMSAGRARFIPEFGCGRCMIRISADS